MISGLKFARQDAVKELQAEMAVYGSGPPEDLAEGVRCANRCAYRCAYRFLEVLTDAYSLDM